MLKGIQTYASVSGELDFTTNRDSFVSCLCKAAIPLNYHVNSAVNSASSKPDGGASHSGGHGGMSNSSSTQSLTNNSNATPGNREVHNLNA